MKVELVNNIGDIVGVTRSGEGTYCNPNYVTLAASTKRNRDTELNPDREYDTVEISLNEQETEMLISMLRG